MAPRATAGWLLDDARAVMTLEPRIDPVTNLRADLALVAAMVPPQARVLDVGCGEGELLAYLAADKDIDGRGMELSQAGVNACVTRGLSVVQGDADKDLSDYPSNAFDIVILSQTIQATRNPRAVLENLLRIGARVIVSFPNFGHWQVRGRLLLGGRMPVTRALDEPWHSTPNIHLCTILDFVDLARELGASVEHAIIVDRFGEVHNARARPRYANLIGVNAVFRLTRAALE